MNIFLIGFFIVATGFQLVLLSLIYRVVKEILISVKGANERIYKVAQLISVLDNNLKKFAVRQEKK